MSKYIVKRRWTNDIICEGDDLITLAEGNKADLQGADLRGAHLQGAHLRGADLRGAHLQGADLQGADLRGAHLQGADLRGAHLRGAHLQGADLRGAHLRGAHLQGAHLQGAHLQGADLREAKNLNKYITTPLWGMYDQVEPLVGYKIVNTNNEGIYNGGIKYEVGKEVLVENWDSDERNSCGAGINLATLDWCIKEWKETYMIFIVEFNKKDIVCIPIGSDGKFRVKRCRVIGKKDLKEIGLGV